MRIALKVIFYAFATAALCWLVPQIAASFHRATEVGSTPDASRAYALFALYLLAGAGLALFAAWDASRFLGDLAGGLFWGGGRIASVTPTWWKAERLCREQRPGEAVQILRDYLSAHPRQWRVAVRIAEIYQHQIKDTLSAALEYEELLKRRLRAAEHAEILLRLAACRLRLGEADRCAALLHEVVERFPRSKAAETARRRLARLAEPAEP